MDRAKKPGTGTGTGTSIANRNSKIYLDFKDVIRENVLQFLPAKSVRRCTGVCRDWRLYISSPFFAHNQSHMFRNVSGFFCQSASSLPSFISLDPMSYGVPDPSLKFLPELVDIRCSSNGLLCCQGRTGCRAYYICNPVTNQWRKLPKPEADHGSEPALVLIHEPSLLKFVAEYTLICAFPSDLDGLEFEIYSSTEGSWRTSGEICFGNRKIVQSTGVYVDGVVYWQSRNYCIIAFDLASERSTLLYHHHMAVSATLGVVNKKLCCASMLGSRLTIAKLSNAYTNTTSGRVRAWETKYITLDHSVLNGKQGTVMFVGDILVIQSGSTLVSYDMKTEHIKQLATEGEKPAKIMPYVNSLVEI